jgi:hypothetical protein
MEGQAPKPNQTGYAASLSAMKKMVQSDYLNKTVVVN